MGSKSEIMGDLRGAIEQLKRAQRYVQGLWEDPQEMVAPHTCHEMVALIDEGARLLEEMRGPIESFDRVAKAREEEKV